MADLAHTLIRLTSRIFYTPEHSLVLEALIHHSTLPDHDLAHLLSIQTKHLRKLCGRLREDGLLAIQTRAERRTDGTGASWFGGSNNGTSMAGKERLSNKDWYYLNFHRAIDSVKYRLWKLSKHIEAQGAPEAEKKDLVCPQCKSQWTELEVLDRIDFATGAFLCARCGHDLEPVDPDEASGENEGMKRLNVQLAKLLSLMRKIDATPVPENDFAAALEKMRPVERGETHPAQRTETVDLPDKLAVASSRGLAQQREEIAVQVQNDEDVRKAADAEDERLRKEKEARQNALPEWIATSTVSGEITVEGAKERARNDGLGVVGSAAKAEREEKGKAGEGEGEDVMAAYWAELAAAKEKAATEAVEEEEENDEEDEDEDEFEDVDVSTPAVVPNGAAASNGGPATGVSSSNATDDERDAKRVLLDEAPAITIASAGTNGVHDSVVAEDTPAASDEDDDELEYENV